MSVIDTLITDRTAADVSAIRQLNNIAWGDMSPDQQTTWNADSKGAYNASDLNRVGSACDYVYNLLLSNGYDTPGYETPKTDWTDGDIPTIEQLETYIGNVAALKARLSMMQEMPANMRFLSYEGANQIERMLVAANDILEKMAQSFVYCGQTFCGQIWTEFGG